VRGAFDGGVPEYPCSRPNKIQPALINRRLNHIEALYPYFTLEGKNTDQSGRDVYCEEYKVLAKRMLDLVFGGMGNAREKLRLPTRLADPIAIWVCFLFQLAWARIPDSWLLTSNSTEANDTFQTLWPENVSPSVRQGNPLINDYSKGILTIDAMEIDGVPNVSRLGFSPALNLYVYLFGRNRVKATGFGWGWGGIDIPELTIEDAGSNITKHKIIDTRLFFEGRSLDCGWDPLPHTVFTIYFGVRDIRRFHFPVGYQPANYPVPHNFPAPSNILTT